MLLVARQFVDDLRDERSGEQQQNRERRQIDIVSLDPFVKSHSLEENSNSAIDDVVGVLADLAERFNVAVGERTTLNQLFEMLRERMLPKLPHLVEFKPLYDDFRRGDVRNSHADISKARRLLNYEPMHHIEQGLDEALGWYLANLAHRAICEGALQV